MTTSKNNLSFSTNNFELIRFIAALQVAVVHGIHHFNIAIPGALNNALHLFPGVPVFFVISGFLVSASFERNKNLVEYFKSRALRIYPALWVCFLISLIAFMIITRKELSISQLLAWTATQVTILQFYNPPFVADYGIGSINGSLWTITVELQFYIALPIFYWVISKVKSPKKIIVALIITFAVVNQWFAYFVFFKGGLANVSLAPYFYMFLIGILIQKNRGFVAKHLQDKAHIWLAAYLTSSAVAAALDIPFGGNLINPVSAAILGLLVISLAYTTIGNSTEILRGNDMSYGIYIYHMAFANMLLEASTLSDTENFVAMLTLTLAAAFASWRLVEKPALSLKNSARTRASQKS